MHFCKYFPRVETSRAIRVVFTEYYVIEQHKMKNNIMKRQVFEAARLIDYYKK